MCLHLPFPKLLYNKPKEAMIDRSLLSLDNVLEYSKLHVILRFAYTKADIHTYNPVSCFNLITALKFFSFQLTYFNLPMIAVILMAGPLPDLASHS